MSEPREFCHACAMPPDVPGFRGPSAIYCSHCTDADGRLFPRDEIQKGIATWFLQWQPGIDLPTAMARADHYLRSMPAWAED